MFRCVLLLGAQCDPLAREALKPCVNHISIQLPCIRESGYWLAFVSPMSLLIAKLPSYGLYTAGLTVNVHMYTHTHGHTPPSSPPLSLALSSFSRPSFRLVRWFLRLVSLPRGFLVKG